MISSDHTAAPESPTNTTSNPSNEIPNPSLPLASNEVPNTSLPVSADAQIMNKHLLKACNDGELQPFNDLVRDDPNILSSVTPDGNNCLHLAAMLGHHDLAKNVWSLSTEHSLFSSTNKEGETPLVLALAAANGTLATEMITAATQHLQPDISNAMEQGKPLNEMLLKVDIRGDNVLHHAMRNNLEDLAINLLNIEPRLAEHVNKIEESPMHMAARRGQSKVLQKLINIPSSATSGPKGFTVLHAAVDAGSIDIIKQLLKGLPKITDHKCASGSGPLVIAVVNGNLEIVKILLEHDPILGYSRTKNGFNPFLIAARKGFVQIAEEIFRFCPDSAYATSNKGGNALHIAVGNERTDFVKYILRVPKLHRLIHQTDTKGGDLPLHIASRMCNPELLRPLLNYKRQDYTAFNASNANAVDIVTGKTALFKTLKWNESYTLVSNLIPAAWRNSAIDEAKKEIKKQAIQEVRSLTERYTTNTSLVAALLATITFAAAFTLPGGYSSDTSNAGQPIFGMQAAFQVFLISDTIAMCSSLAVAFLCIFATWEDLDFLLNYRKTTRALMWCAYVCTVVAFGTGLFTMIAPKNMGLAVVIVILSSILPFVSKIIGEWPLLRLRFRLGRRFKKALVPNI